MAINTYSHRKFSTEKSCKSFRSFYLFVTIASVLSALPLCASEMASATYTAMQLTPSTYEYDLTLDNIGTTNIGTFWFAWVPGEDFMPTSPTNVVSPANWTDNVTHGGAGDGFAIQWLATTVLAPGDVLGGFSFVSTTTPTEMAGLAAGFPGTPPVTTSFIYSGAPFSDAGFQFVVAEAATPTVPEPSSLALFAVGMAFFVAAFASTRLLRKSSDS